ncbi:MAG: hypothetical protein WC428_07690 [Candidatus Paceibacterota bacterium]|jgi:hypothetical protein
MIFFDELVSKLQESDPFSFVRYGDGEWACIFGMQSKNCDGNIYFTDLGKALEKIVLSQPHYYMGMQYGALVSDYYNLKDKIYPFIWDLNINWVNADILHRASEFNKIQPFFKALKARQVILVGANYFDRLKLFPFIDHVIIPPHNCWLVKDTIYNQLVEKINRLEAGLVVLFMASMTTNVLIDDLYKIFGHNTTFIDIGSVFDPYLGLNKRRYHYKIINRE